MSHEEFLHKIPLFPIAHSSPPNLMRGKKQAPKRTIHPDSRYQSVVIAKLINHVMSDGKKTVAQKIVYGALSMIAEKTKLDPLDVFDEAMKKIAPLVEVRGRRVGGANYQVPIEVGGARRMTLAFRWLIGAAQAKKGKTMHVKLAEEIMAASKGEGDAVKKREEVQRMADANRAFAHFA